jgi:hypothetical protein
MQFQFECGCGVQLSDYTRGVGDEVTTQVQCQSCGTVYALTITPIVTRYD